MISIALFSFNQKKRGPEAPVNFFFKEDLDIAE